MTLLTTLKTFDGKACKKFVAAEHFKDKDFCLFSTFKEHFLPKTETNVPKEKLRLSKLNEDSVDGPIREALGANHEITLAQFFEFLKTADKGGWYIAYIEDHKGEVMTVSCLWGAGYGWRVEADAISGPYDWFADYRVLSRDSSETLSADSKTLENFDSLNARIEELELDIQEIRDHLGMKRYEV